MARGGVSPVSRRYRFVAVGAVALAIVVASVVDPEGTGAETALAGGGPFGFVGVDKWVHGTAYATLALLGAYALADRPTSRATRPRTLALVVCGVVAFGVGIEVVQSALPARASDLVDVAANATGAVVGVGVWSVLARVSPVRTTGRRHER